jgi:hypothetical protein
MKKYSNQLEDELKEKRQKAINSKDWRQTLTFIVENLRGKETSDTDLE